MPRMIHGDFKPGEICRESGTYECGTCAARSRSTRIAIDAGGTFPECSGCKERGSPETDMIWRIVRRP